MPYNTTEYVLFQELNAIYRMGLRLRYHNIEGISMLDILYVFDDNYAPYAGISITSLLENNKRNSIRIFCVGTEVSSENRKKIDSTVQKSGQLIEWIDPAESIRHIESHNTGSWHGSKATWMKVFCLWELPKEIDRILYIDSDTIVTGDLQEIAKIDIEGAPVAMVLDSSAILSKRDLGLEKYYNAGVILFNLDFWRDEGFKERFFSHLKNRPKRYRDNEQGLINDFFRDRIVKLPLKYNVQGFLIQFKAKNYLKAYNASYYDELEIETAKKKPAICHFFRAFGSYPWEKGNIHPYKKLYREWKDKSSWKDKDDIERRKMRLKREAEFAIEKILYYILPEKIYLSIFKRTLEKRK